MKTNQSNKELAESKINRMNLNQAQKDVALYDWKEGEEHWTWILTSTEEEIIDWIETVLR